MYGTGSIAHSYSPRPAAWLLAGLILCIAAHVRGQEPERTGDPTLWPPVDIVLVWVGDREPEPKRLPEPAPAPETVPPPAVAKSTPPAAAKNATPSLNLDSLESRLRETRALGLFTKLELKNQVGGLVKEVDDFHRHRSDLSIDELEQRFDLLLLKLLVLLQDKDPKLHREIADARPVLWATLSDPEQFATVKGP